MLNPLAFLAGRMLAERAGVDQRRASELGLLGSVFPLATGMALSTTLADREVRKTVQPVLVPGVKPGGAADKALERRLDLAVQRICTLEEQMKEILATLQTIDAKLTQPAQTSSNSPKQAR